MVLFTALNGGRMSEAREVSLYFMKTNLLIFKNLKNDLLSFSA